MMRSLLLLGTVTLLLCGALTAFAQIPNPSFESWTGGNPDNWFTNNLAALSWVPLTQSRTAHSGTYSARGDVITITGGTAYSPQIVAGTTLGGFAWTQRSGNITGYYQFFPAAGSGDRISVIGFLMKGGQNGVGVAAAGGYVSTAASSWTQFSVPFTYITADVPDWSTLSFIIVGPGSTNPHAGSYFLLDDLAYAGTATDVSNNGTSVPNSFGLEQNYPNPFNPSTRINFSLAQPGFVTLKIYDVLGTEVTTLVNEQRSSGSYQVNWNAAGLSSGVYLYKIMVSSESGPIYTAAKKLVLVK